jgi:threonine dehydratase
MPSLDDIRRAAERIRDVAHRTPLEPSRTFSEWCGAEVWFKHEQRQRTGSFKVRGAYNKMASIAPERRAAGVVAASAGNHAQGVASAASALGVPATVYMPVDASLAKMGATREYGAEVELVGETFEEAVAAAVRDAEHGGKTLVHPFDDEAVIAGQGTVGLEIAEDAPEDVDAVIVPLGGGGLLSGIAIAMKELRPSVRVIGVEVEGYAAFGEGDPRTGRHNDTIADGIAVKQPGEITLPLVRRFVDDIVTVTDAQIAQTIIPLLEREKVVIEGAGAAAAAALLHGRVRARRPVAVLSGGNIDTPRLVQVIRFGLTTAGRYLVVRTRLEDRPGELMHLLKVIADAHVNILLVSHHREGIDMSVAETGIELTMETRGEAHAEDIVGLLRDAGYPITRIR